MLRVRLINIALWKSAASSAAFQWPLFGSREQVRPEQAQRGRIPGATSPDQTAETTLNARHAQPHQIGPKEGKRV